jgi:TatD DNase family protein
MKLVDSHCHLFYDVIYANLAEKIRFARLAGVEYMLSVATDTKTTPINMEIAEKYNNVCCSVGIHPHHAREEYSIEQLKSLTAHRKVVAVGEVGLDYHYDDGPSRNEQISLFEEMLSISTELPYIFHARQCFDDILDILKQSNVGSGVFHCYTDSLENAKKIIDLGYYISFSGAVTFQKSDEIREVAKYVPIDRILVETDCPYLTPVPYRKKTNEPAYTSLVAECVAQVRGIPIEEVANSTTENFFNLFSKAAVMLDDA